MQLRQPRSVRYALAVSCACIASDSQHVHNELNSNTAWWIRLLTGYETNSKCMLTPNVYTFNNFCNASCLKINSSCGKTTGYLRSIHIFEESNAAATLAKK